jgi:hypothetical protein
MTKSSTKGPHQSSRAEHVGNAAGEVYRAVAAAAGTLAAATQEAAASKAHPHDVEQLHNAVEQAELELRRALRLMDEAHIEPRDALEADGWTLAARSSPLPADWKDPED